MIQTKTRYRFRYSRSPHAKGDPVPDSYTPGTIATMLEYGRIEPVPGPAPYAPVTDPATDKALEHAPADKMARPGMGKRKGGA